MKRWILALAMAATPLAAWAFQEVWSSSYTNVAATTQKLCEGKRGYLHGVVISTAGANGSNIQLSNSSWTVTATPTTGAIDTRSVRTEIYNVIFSTGIIYTKTGVAGLTILYQCY